MDQKVQDVLSSATQFYAGLQSFNVDVASTTKITMTGIKQEMDSTCHVALSRPNFFALVPQSGLMGMCGGFYCDGKTCVTYYPLLKKYSSTDAPAQLSDLFKPFSMIMVVGGLPLGLESFLIKDPLKTFQQGLTQSEYLGLEKIGDVQAHHIRLHGTPYITDLWIADGPTPFLLQSQTSQDMAALLKNLPAKEKKGVAQAPVGLDMMKSMTMLRINVFSNWKMNQPVASATFEFQPPPDAKLDNSMLGKQVVPPKPKPADTSGVD